MEPPIGIEPMTYALREARYRALGPLPAPMPHESATTALKTLGLPATPFHDPSLVAWLCRGTRTVLVAVFLCYTGLPL